MHMPSSCITRACVRMFIFALTFVSVSVSVFDFVRMFTFRTHFFVYKYIPGTRYMSYVCVCCGRSQHAKKKKHPREDLKNNKAKRAVHVLLMLAVATRFSSGRDGGQRDVAREKYF